MEKFNEKFNFNGGENILKSICWILSYLSWLLLAINNIASLKYLYQQETQIIWNIIVMPPPSGIYINPEKDYIPMQMDHLFIYIVFNFYIIISFVGCIVYIIKTLFIKEQQVIDGMMGNFSKFHFFPLLCAFILSVLGEAADGDNLDDISKTGLAFSLIGLISMIFIYIMTQFKSQDWWAEYSLKNGVYSCLIILFWYNFCYSIYLVRSVSNVADVKWIKGCSLAFSIIFGIGSLTFSVIFKDIMITFMNMLIYLGMAIQYFNIGEDTTSGKDFNKNGDGAIDIIMLICSFILLVYLIVGILKNELMQIKNNMLTLSNVQNQTILKVNSNSQQINLISNNINLNTKN